MIDSFIQQCLNYLEKEKIIVWDEIMEEYFLNNDKLVEDICTEISNSSSCNSWEIDSEIIKKELLKADFIDTEYENITDIIILHFGRTKIREVMKCFDTVLFEVMENQLREHILIEYNIDELQEEVLSLLKIS